MKIDIHAIARWEGQGLADEVGNDRELSSPSVDQHRQPDAARPSIVEHAVNRGANGAPGLHYIIHEHDIRAFDVEWNLARANAWIRQAGRGVISIERDIHATERQPLVIGEALSKPLRKRQAPALDRDKADGSTADTSEDFARKALHGTIHGRSIEYGFYRIAELRFHVHGGGVREAPWESTKCTVLLRRCFLARGSNR